MTSVSPQLSSFLRFFLLLISATTAVISVSEIASRDSLTSLLRSHGDLLRTEYFELTRNRALTSPPVDGKQSLTANSAAKQIALADEIDSIATLERRVRMLASLGAENVQQTLEGTRREFEQYRINRDNRAALERLTSELATAEVAAAQTRSKIKTYEDALAARRERAAQLRRAAESSEAEYRKLKDAVQSAALAIETLLRRQEFLKSRIDQIDGPQLDTMRKELLSMPDKLETANEKYREADSKFKSRYGSSVPMTAAPSPTTISEADLENQLALERMKLAQAEASVQKTNTQIRSYRLSETPVAQHDWWPFPRLHSDYLLAVAVISCGALGALISGLRSGSSTVGKDLSLGIATGFVCYFAIKGGKYLFLLNTSSEYIAFNPYGSAFAGLLVGLFSERVYSLLAALVNDFESRLKQAISAGSSGQPKT